MKTVTENGRQVIDYSDDLLDHTNLMDQEDLGVRILSNEAEKRIVNDLKTPLFTCELENRKNKSKKRSRSRFRSRTRSRSHSPHKSRGKYRKGNNSYEDPRRSRTSYKTGNSSITREKNKFRGGRENFHSKRVHSHRSSRSRTGKRSISTRQERVHESANKEKKNSHVQTYREESRSPQRRDRWYYRDDSYTDRRYSHVPNHPKRYSPENRYSPNLERDQCHNKEPSWALYESAGFSSTSQARVEHCSPNRMQHTESQNGNCSPAYSDISDNTLFSADEDDALRESYKEMTPNNPWELDQHNDDNYYRRRRCSGDRQNMNNERTMTSYETASSDEPDLNRHNFEYIEHNQRQHDDPTSYHGPRFDERPPIPAYHSERARSIDDFQDEQKSNIKYRPCNKNLTADSEDITMRETPIILKPGLPLKIQLESIELETEVVGEVVKKLIRHKNSVPLKELFNYMTQTAGIPFDSIEDFRNFLVERQDTFHRIEKDGKLFVSADISINICEKHLQKQSPTCNETCRDLHVCMFYIFGTCPKSSCFSHDLYDAHNLRALKYFFLHRVSSANIKAVMSAPENRTITTLPMVCSFYNKIKGCARKGCSCLHVCRAFIDGNCKFLSRCKRLHNFDNVQCQKVLGKFALEQITVVEYKMLLQNGRKPMARSISASSSNRSLDNETRQKVQSSRYHTIVKQMKEVEEKIKMKKNKLHAKNKDKIKYEDNSQSLETLVVTQENEGTCLVPVACAIKQEFSESKKDDCTKLTLTEQISGEILTRKQTDIKEIRTDIDRAPEVVKDEDCDENKHRNDILMDQNNEKTFNYRSKDEPENPTESDVERYLSSNENECMNTDNNLDKYNKQEKADNDINLDTDNVYTILQPGSCLDVPSQEKNILQNPEGDQIMIQYQKTETDQINDRLTSENELRKSISCKQCNGNWIEESIVTKDKGKLLLDSIKAEADENNLFPTSNEAAIETGDSQIQNENSEEMEVDAFETFENKDISSQENTLAESEDKCDIDLQNQQTNPEQDQLNSQEEELFTGPSNLTLKVHDGEKEYTLTHAESVWQLTTQEGRTIDVPDTLSETFKRSSLETMLSICKEFVSEL